MRRAAFAAFVAVFALPGHASTALSAEPYWPANAKVFFVEPKDGAEITGPVKAVMGAEGVEIAPAGTEKPGTGHFHILIDTDIPTGAQAEYPLPADDHNRHYGKGQTEATLTLAPGAHTLQLLFADGNHVPHEPALASKKITITVK